jgi:hypothetical protein
MPLGIGPWNHFGFAAGLPGLFLRRAEFFLCPGLRRHALVPVGAVWESLHAIVDAGHTRFAGAMGAAIEGPFGFDAMADDLAIAVLTLRGEGVNGAFEAVEIMGLAADGDFHRFVVIVSANFAFVHNDSSICFRV